MEWRLNYQELYNSIKQSSEPILGVDIFSITDGRVENIDIIDLSTLIIRVKVWNKLVEESKSELLKILNNYKNKEEFKYEIVFLSKEMFKDL